MSQIALLRKRRSRKRKGFVLIAVLVFAITSILYLMAILPLMDTIVRLESFGRSSSELRSAAEGGVDYAMEQLNEFSAKYPSLTCPLINAGVTPLPLPYLKNLPNGTITVDVKSVTPGDWGTINNDSTIYNKNIDPKLGQYLVVDSEAKRGLWRSHIRVFLEPSCNVPSLEGGEYSNSTTSYFKQPLIAREITASNPSKLEITKLAGTFEMLATDSIKATGSEVDINAMVFPEPQFSSPTIVNSLGVANASTFDFPPVPSTGSTTEIQTDVGKSLAGSYTSHGNDFTNVSAPLVVDANAVQPVKIYIQDALPTSLTSVEIDARALKNNSADPQNMQLWYNGKGNISLNLTADFAGLIYAPNATVKLAGTHGFYGAVVASSMDLQNSGIMTIDTSSTSNSERNRKSGLLYATGPNGAFTRRGYKAVSWQEVSEVP